MKDLPDRAALIPLSEFAFDISIDDRIKSPAVLGRARTWL